jgi:hypothetical protein
MKINSSENLWYRLLFFALQIPNNINTQFASIWDQNTPFSGVYNFGLNPERVAGSVLDLTIIYDLVKSWKLKSISNPNQIQI